MKGSNSPFFSLVVAITVIVAGVGSDWSSQTAGRIGLAMPFDLDVEALAGVEDSIFGASEFIAGSGIRTARAAIIDCSCCEIDACWSAIDSC